MGGARGAGIGALSGFLASAVWRAVFSGAVAAFKAGRHPPFAGWSGRTCDGIAGVEPRHGGASRVAVIPGRTHHPALVERWVGAPHHGGRGARLYWRQEDVWARDPRL